MPESGVFKRKGNGLDVQILVTGDLQENCGLVWRSGQDEVAIVDAGDDAPDILGILDARHLHPVAFLQTHCHGDHLGAWNELKKAFPEARFHVHEAERDWPRKPVLNLSYFLGAPVTAPEPDVLFRDGFEFDAAGLHFRAIHVPGHSPGGTAFFVEDPGQGPPHLFSGDILFQGGIGRVDFPGCEGEEVLVAGIRQKLFILPDETIVHCGHGPDTTIGREKRMNPFCGGA